MTNQTPWPALAPAAEPALPFSLARCTAAGGHRGLEDMQFREMALAFGASGGLASCNELAHVLRRRTRQPLELLTRLIGERQALSFEWQARTMLPLFQFDLPALALRSTVTPVIAELSDTFDAWDLALWFAQANEWLHGRAPVTLIEHAPRWVLEAARADRYIARG
jgi:hypothetical protein